MSIPGSSQYSISRKQHHYVLFYLVPVAPQRIANLIEGINEKLQLAVKLCPGASFPSICISS